MYLRMLGQYWLNNLSAAGPVNKVHGSGAIRAACFPIVLLHKHVGLKAGRSAQLSIFSHLRAERYVSGSVRTGFAG